MPSKAPPQMNKIFFVLIYIRGCSGCFLPPCGGTPTTLPSMILSNACCTPSPETSRVTDGLAPFLPILSISSMKIIPCSALSIV